MQPRSTRAAIRSGLALACTERWYPQVTIAQVASCAGMSQAVISRHYANKSEILVDLLAASVETLREKAVAACAEAGPDGWLQIEAALRSVLAWVAANASQARLLLVEIDADGPSAFQVRDEGRRWFEDRLLEKASPHPGLPDPTGEFLVGGIASMLGQRVVAGQADSAPELAETMLAFLRLPFDEAGAGVCCGDTGSGR